MNYLTTLRTLLIPPWPILPQLLRHLAAPLGTTHLGAQLRERFDEHRRLDGHVQTAGDARALERLRRTVLLTERHETGHLVLGHDDVLATPFGQLDVGCRQRRAVQR